MKIVFLSIALASSIFVQAQVGIGTATPNNNSILDLSSPNKALLLPRVSDTTAVVTPAAGMMVYSQQSQSPSFHDGARWNSVNALTNGIYGSMTYTVTGSTSGGIAFDINPLAAIDLHNHTFSALTSGGSGSGSGTIRKADSVTLFKEFDGNSIVFKRAHLAGQFIQTIEINYFLPNGTKYYSVKLSDVLIVSQHYLMSETSGKLTERYGLMFSTIGYKDWINNKSFSYNPVARTYGTY